ncbi:hypothetical protein KAU11_10785 [Candidatus Babeliales bacterium]|nr:hypothetical protein [Candidatus Babeliales bacterium]
MNTLIIWNTLLTIGLLYALLRKPYAGDMVVHNTTEMLSFEWLKWQPEAVKELIGYINEYQLNSTGKINE